jgi:hypothetical protein
MARPGGDRVIRAELEFRAAAHIAEQAALDAIRAQPPLLPALEHRPPRWQSTHWLALLTRPLVKHVALDWSAYLVTLDEWAPAGFRPAFHLGAASLLPQPNTVRLVEVNGSYSVQPEYEPLPAGGRSLGFISSASLAEMEPLERRLLRFDDGEIEVLCAGPADPHYRESEHVETLGWIEPYPIAPRATAGVGARRTSRLLVRRQEPEAWRHVLLAASEPPGGEFDHVLGSLLTRPGPGTVPLTQDADGRVSTPGLPAQDERDPLAAAKWAAAPLRWDDVEPRERRSAARVRAGYLAGRHRSEPQPVPTGVLGHLRRDPAEGWVALYRATHPVIGDHFVTRFDLEAADLGYRVDGVLGFASALGASRGAGPETIHWASRAGRGRRYEDSLPADDAPRGPLPAPVDDEDEYAVGRVALAQPASAAGLATLGLRPGERIVHEAPGGAARRAIALTADGADAALSAIGFEQVLAQAADDGWDVVIDASGAGLDAVVEELRGSYDEVFALPPGSLLERPGVARSFADVQPYRRRRGEMLRAAASAS